MDSSSEINPEVKAKIIEMQVVTVPWQFNRRSITEIREEIKEYAKSDEDDVNVLPLPTTSEEDFLGATKIHSTMYHYKQ